MQSMCLGYYNGITWEQAQEMFRGAARDTIAERWREAHAGHAASEVAQFPRTLLDVGCSGGFSTHEMAKAFLGIKATGLDLSPYYLAVAKRTYPQFNFVHGLAEHTSFPDGAFDVATLNFILHELPLAASCEVLREMHRIVVPGGVLAIFDVDPRRVLELPPFRRWAFQLTEPWCKENEYFALDAAQVLKDIGFNDVQCMSNDQVNALILATK